MRPCKRMADRARILALIQARGEYGCTDDEGEALLGILAQSYTPRRGELVAREMVKPTARTRLTRNGCKAIVWVAAKHARCIEEGVA